jgi:hypothetical protein
LFKDEFGPDELHILTAAFERLCTPDMSEDKRNELRTILLDLSKDGLTTVDELVERAEELLGE